MRVQERGQMQQLGEAREVKQTQRERQTGGLGGASTDAGLPGQPPEMMSASSSSHHPHHHHYLHDVSLTCQSWANLWARSQGAGGQS